MIGPGNGGVAVAGRAPIRAELVEEHVFRQWSGEQSPAVRALSEALGFTAAGGTWLPVPDEDGTIQRFAVGVRSPGTAMRDVSEAASRLPGGLYRLEGAVGDTLFRAALGWRHGTYRAVPDPRRGRAELEMPVDGSGRYSIVADASDMARKLVDAPPNELGPEELAAKVAEVGHAFGACVKILDDVEIARRGFGGISAVGGSSPRGPRLADFVWGDADAFKVTLVGKGVCFDSGGLNLKRTDSIRHMKRDMGGAALMLALASIIMRSNLPCRLRLLVPCLDNSVSGSSYRPSDVIRMYDGRRVEIANTDAEGRLVLADALHEADSESPDLLVDCGTLTGSPRACIGPDFAVVMSPGGNTSMELVRCGEQAEDPVWPLPLWTPYREWLKSPIADLANTSGTGMAGPIVAALFLKEFVSLAKEWIHIDAMAWNPIGRHGRPAGAEATGLYALERFIRAKLGT